MSTPLADELQRHAAALRALASSLVGADGADDLVQAAAVSAMRVRGRVDRPAALLRRILERLASKHRRGERRRLAREAEVVPPRPSPGPDWIAAHRETVQQVHAALFALPEPFLGVLLLRYFEDLPPTAIAARLQLPLPTVKSRLQRGLELLRERISATASDHDWRAGLVAAFGLRGSHAATTGAAATATGAILMTIGTKWLLSSLAAALLVVAAWAALGDVAPSAGSAQDAAVATATAADTFAASGPSPTNHGERREAAPAAAGTTTSATTIRGRCTDEGGQPIAGCRVSLTGSRPDHETLAGWVRRNRDFDWQDPEPQTTGADGCFEWRIVPHEPLSFAMRALAAGRVEMMCRWPSRLAGEGLPPGGVVELGDLVLAAGTMLRGRVVDGAGNPVAASLYARWVGETGVDGSPHARTDWHFRSDVTGHFSLPGALPTGPCQLAVYGRRFADGSAALSRDLPAGDAWVELVVAAIPVSPSIRGTVVDDTGRGVFAFVVATTEDRDGRPLRAEASENGEFELQPKRPGQVVTGITVVGDERQDGAHLEGPFAWGTDGLRLVVRRGVDVELRVTDADGLPVEEFAAWFACDRAPANTGGFGLSAGSAPLTFGRHVDGRALLQNRRRGSYTLFVEPRQTDLECSPLVQVEVTGGEPQRIDLALPRRAERTVRLVDGKALPVVDSDVELVEVLATDRLPPRSFHRIESYFTGGGSRRGGLIRHRATTGARGEAKLSGPAGRIYVVRAPGPHNVEAIVCDVSLDVAEPLVIRVTRGASLRVRLTPPDIVSVLQDYGTSFGGVTDMLPELRLKSDPTKVSSPGPVERIRGDGSVAFSGVVPGRWHLAVQFPVALSSAHSVMHEQILGVVELSDGEDAMATFDLARLRPGRLSATVMHNGEPWADQSVTLEADWGDSPYGRIPQSVRLRTDAAGRFERNLRPGTYTLVQPFSADETWVVAPRADVLATFTVRSGRLRLTLRNRDGTAAAGQTLHIVGRGGGEVKCTTDEAGMIEAELPAGPAELRWEPLRAGGDPSARVSLGGATIPVGQVVHLEKQVPELVR